MKPIAGRKPKEEKYCYVSIELSESEVKSLCTMLEAKRLTGSFCGILDEIGQRIHDKLVVMSEAMRKRNEANNQRS